MKKFVCAFLCFMNIGVSWAYSIYLHDLRCENLVNPLGIDNVSPHFSWKITGEVPMRQQCYEIQVGSDSLRLLEGSADLWNSGRVESDESVMIAYGGKALCSRMLCYWRVRVGNERGELSAWSPVQKFSIGLLDHEDFHGHYIGLAQGDVRAPLLRKSFVVENRRTAFLHVNSLGYHEVYVNGVKADTQVLSPAVSQLDKRSLIVTYDVTPLLSVGKNEIVLWLGVGWYKKGGHFSAQYEGPVVKAELDALEDGEWKTWLVTDDTWQGSESGYVDMGSWKALHFGGERIDARMVPSVLSASELDKRPWGKVAVVDIRRHKVSPQMCEPNRIQETLAPKSISPLGKDTWLIDMGRVLTGWFGIQLSQLPTGHEVVASYSDYMKPDGQIEEQGEKDVYVTSGKPGGDEFCNKFHYHAFRYVKLSNLPYRPTTRQIKAHLVHGDYQSASSFKCSDNDLNAIHDMVNYTLRCLTFSGYMVDCPHLERMGYGGDGNSSTLALQEMYDVSPTYLNWMQAWQDAMRENGSLPHTAPCGGGGGGPYWCGFVVLAPWRTYINYGDTRLLERYYGTMKSWMEYVEQYMPDGLLERWPDTPYRSWFLGDWLAPKGVDVTDSASVALITNCVVSQCYDAMSKVASVLGRKEEVSAYRERKISLNERIHETFYHPEERIYASGSQLDMAYPMLVGVVPADLYGQIADNLKKRTELLGNGHIGAGLVGVAVLTDWAIRNREADFMYRMLKQQDYPGYLYMLNHGATTTWESWDGERSRVHNCYNGIGNWFYQAIGGIWTDERIPGYKHVFIAPQVPKGVTWADVSKETPYGTVRVKWNLVQGKMKLRLDVPVGVTADVVVPSQGTGCIVNNRPVASEGNVVLGAGVYDIEFSFAEVVN